MLSVMGDGVSRLSLLEFLGAEGSQGLLCNLRNTQPTSSTIAPRMPAGLLQHAHGRRRTWILLSLRR